MTDANNNVLGANEGDFTSVMFFVAIGAVVVVAMVFLGTGLYYGMERETSASTEGAPSALWQTTVVDVRERLECWSKRFDEETKTEHLTSPIQHATRLVQSELRTGQGR